MKNLPLLNLLILIGIIIYLIYNRNAASQNEVFSELSTERLNIVDKDGNQFVVISSPEKQALATINGELIDPDETERPVPGLIFFNQEGDEIGGLVFGIDSTSSYQLLTFDQRKGDQIMTLRKEEQLVDGDWKRRYGLLLQERSEKPTTQIISEIKAINQIEDSLKRSERLEAFYSDPENLAPQRLFLGRTYSGKTGLFLMDKDNQLRLSLYVDSDGNAVIQKIDSLGNKTEMQ